MHLQYYREAAPIPAARRFIRRVIYCDCDEPITLNVPAPPTGYNHVGWALRGSGAKLLNGRTLGVAEGEVHFAGQTYRTVARMVLQGRVRHMLAEMTAAGLFATFGFSGERLVNRVVSAVDAGLPDFQIAMSRVPQNASMEEALVLFQRAIVACNARAAVPSYVGYAADAIEESQGLVPMSALSSGVSDRQFQRGFKRIVGCSPKYFAQVLRVNATIVSLVERREDNLADVAARHGFSDQPHMVRAIQTYFGHAPSDIRNNVDMMIRAFPTAGARDGRRQPANSRVVTQP